VKALKRLAKSRVLMLYGIAALILRRFLRCGMGLQFAPRTPRI
jgi:hypothetical protein